MGEVQDWELDELVALFGKLYDMRGLGVGEIP